MDPAPRLSCQQCKRRKTRCDKGNPCTACTAAGLRCHSVQRARLPRGKSGNVRDKSELMEARVARIEKMLSRRPGAYSKLGDVAGQEHGSWYQARSASRIGEFVAPEFWTSLSEEVQGLRETLESYEDEDEQELDKAAPASQDTNTTLSAGAIVFGQTGESLHDPELPVPTAQMRAALLGLYRERVDKMYKMLHWPTTHAAIEAAYSGDGQDAALSQSEKCLEYSIYFIAMCVARDEEAASLGLHGRSDLVRQYRGAVESLLARSSLLLYPDVPVLQAFVTYLMGLRSQINSGFIWSLTALAVRAGESLRLGQEDPRLFSQFDLEVRRRLLFLIGTIDTYSAIDRGTLPMLSTSIFMNPPLDINDSQISPGQTSVAVSPPPSEETDMSFAAMIYHAMVCQRKLYELCYHKQPGWEDWGQKLEIVASWEQFADQRFSAIADSSPPFRRFQKHMARFLTDNLHFMFRRPPCRQPRDAVPPWDHFDVMTAAGGILRQNLLLQGSPEFLPWSWKFCVPWSVLAIALIELSNRPWTTNSTQVYEVASESFRETARTIADTRLGMLWKPITRLMRQADRARTRAYHASNAKIFGSALPSLGLWDSRDMFEGLDAAETRPQLPATAESHDTGGDGMENGLLGLEVGDAADWLGDAQLDPEASWTTWDLFLQDTDGV